VRCTSLPDQFFSQLLPAIDTLAELKVTLHVYWRLYRQKSYPRYLSEGQLRADAALLRGLDDSAEIALDRLEQGLERAVARGTLLQLTTWQGHGQEAMIDAWYFLNDPEGRRAYREIQEGTLEPDVHLVPPEPPPQERPGIFNLYEQHVGLVSPIIAQELAEAAKVYPARWIEEAFEIAVERGVRRWRYVRGILERWRREGKNGKRT
jgi:DnaD/phage-associated family protein